MENGDSKNTGNESAYPLHPESGERNENGLTKRELFAAMAMQGLMANSCPEINEMTYEQIASAYLIQADALLTQLNS